MPTSSIFANFNITDKETAESFVNAIEKSEKILSEKQKTKQEEKILPTQSNLACQYCSYDYHQEIICISKRYHSSSEYTSKIIPTNFCPVCGHKMN